MTAHHKNEPRPLCPNCSSDYVTKDGDEFDGSKRWKCRTCSRRFRIGRAPKEAVKAEIPHGPYRYAAMRSAEFKPLKRDPFEHWKLCELTRR